MPWHIENATDPDLPFIVDLACGLTRYNREHHPQRDDEATVLAARAQRIRQSFHERGSHTHFFVVRSSDDGRVGGYGLARLLEPDPWEDNGTESVGLVDEVYLLDEVRGHGIGSKLLHAMMRWLEGAGAVHMRLHSYAWNAGANSLYTRLGFEPYAHSWQCTRR